MMGKPIEVDIEKLVHGGKGLARLAMGQSLFVPGVISGERAEVVITRKKKGFFEAELLSIISPSKDRREPPCSGEEQCTGATWPHIAYPAQLRFKEEILLETLSRMAGIKPKRFLPIIPSPRTDHYRLRTQLNVRTSAGRQRIGFFRQGTYTLIEMEDAFLLHPLINKALSGIRGMAELLPELNEIHINAAPSGEVHVLFFGEQKPYPPMESFFERLQEAVPEIIGLTGFVGQKRTFSLGTNHLTLELDGLEFQTTEGNFFQVNWEQNRNMVRSVMDIAGLKGQETVLDLYCGIGNFTLPLAKQAKTVIGIESGYSAVDDARENAKKNGVLNVEFIADDLQRGLKTLIGRKMRADVVVLDPPRAGATIKTLERVLAFVPQKIIYVSCNPSTLARDLKYFHLFGFRLDRLQPVDMFPYTYHIECVAEMVRE